MRSRAPARRARAVDETRHGRAVRAFRSLRPCRASRSARSGCARWLAHSIPGALRSEFWMHSLQELACDFRRILGEIRPQRCARLGCKRNACPPNPNASMTALSPIAPIGTACGSACGSRGPRGASAATVVQVSGAPASETPKVSPLPPMRTISVGVPCLFRSGEHELRRGHPEREE